MYYFLEKTKRAIKDYSVFDGLACDDPKKYASEFLNGSHYLIEAWGMSGLKGYIIFEIINDRLIFKLINVNGGRDVTKTMHDEFLIPFCRKNGVKYIDAMVERMAMARKLKSLGFQGKNLGLYVKEV